MKFEHEDDFFKEVERLFNEKGIECATIAFIGALASADIVTGPKKPKIPAIPTWMSFSDGREVLGFGTIILKNGKMQPHIHATFGKGKTTLTGCLRKNARTFITIEAVITELTDVQVSRKRDEKIQYDLLSFN